MRKLQVTNKKAKMNTATERNLEAKEMLKSLAEHLSEALGTVNYLRNNFEDVLDLNKVKDLFEMSKELENMKKKV